MIRLRSRWLAAVLGSIAVVAPAAWMLARGRSVPSPIVEAERAIEAGDLGGAKTILARILSEEPRQARARLLYARILRLSGRSHDADVALGRAMDLGAPQEDLWREYGLLIAGSDFQRAEPILFRVLAHRPEDTEVLGALADGFSHQGRWSEAAGVYSKWIALEPGRADARLGRGRALALTGGPGEAVHDLRAVVRLRPEDYQARLLLSDCLVATGETAAAEVELEECRRLRPEIPGPLVGLAGCAIEREEPDRALELLNRAVELDPSSIVALTARGRFAINRQRDDLALSDFERVVALDPTHKQGHLQLARIYRRAGDARRAGDHERAYRDLARAPSDAAPETPSFR